ncbi:MAG: hypothetical protein H6877_08130 [Rhodobiaceae bacterium]|nr:hypothetical protein [Planctomycetales bacterium]MCC0013271.1 hypothetical protein [Rhodobiaceae bacterium]
MIEKDTLIYQQSCEEFRSLNGFFWQIPIIMMTLNGGLWYSVASLDLSTSAQRGVLFFAAFANIVMVVGLWRIRSVMQDLLSNIHQFQGTSLPGRSKIIQFLFQALLLFAALGAFAAAIEPESYFIGSSAPSSKIEPCETN